MRTRRESILAERMKRKLNVKDFEQVSRELNETLEGLRPKDLPRFFEQRGGQLLTEPRPFAAYMRGKLEEKGLLRQNVFLAADISEGYGYKLLEEEKRNRRRDVLLRLLLAAHMTPAEAREALILYGIAPLHGRFPRDAVLLTAFGSPPRDVRETDALLRRWDLPPLWEK